MGCQIRLAGEANRVNRVGPTGDLYVVLKCAPARIFSNAAENDIVLELTVNVPQAALGDTIEVPTVDGPTPLTMPGGHAVGKVIKLHGRGVPRLRRDGTASGRGDQMVVINVEIPARLTKEQRDLFEALGRTLGARSSRRKKPGGVYGPPGRFVRVEK